MTTKLTAAQTRILQYLADDGSLTMGWMQSSWRDDKFKAVSDKSMTALRRMGYVDDVHQNQRYKAFITDAGRLAIASPAHADGDTGDDAPVSVDEAIARRDANLAGLDRIIESMEADAIDDELPPPTLDEVLSMLRTALKMCQRAMVQHGNDTNWNCGVNQAFADAMNAARAALKPGEFPEYAHFFDEVDEQY